MNNFQSANQAINQLAGVKPSNKVNTMKPTRLNKAYINFKEELFRELLKAKTTYRDNKTGVNYERVIKLSEMLELVNLMQEDIEN